MCMVWQETSYLYQHNFENLLKVRRETLTCDHLGEMEIEGSNSISNSASPTT